ncbi:MAG: ABC transporter substrate-binding protein [Candidatus Babeliales bacterium]
MKNLTKLIIALSLTLGASAWLILKHKQQHTTLGQKHTTIGILQTASHPALDAARQGFIETLKQALPENIEFIVRNAEGSIPAAHTISQSFKAHNLDGIFAIATPAAQAAASLIHDTPIFIAAVTDPQAAGICKETVGGCTDMVSLEKTINLLQKLAPSARNIAILANTGEINSQVQVSTLQEILKTRGLNPLIFGFTSEADVATAVTSAALKADAILVPNDNTISSSITLVAALALKHKKPLIACDTMLVAKGVLAANGVDYHATGVQAAHQALEVLRGSTKGMTIEQPQQEMIMINKKVADTLQINVPEELAKFAI